MGIGVSYASPVEQDTLVLMDIDYRCWRALGDLSAIIFTLGLNQPSSDYDTKA